MLDLKWIRETPDALDHALARRGAEPVAERLVELDRRRRDLQTRFQAMQARRNEASREIGQRKKAGQEAAELIDEVARLKADIAAVEDDEREVGQALEDLLLALPNPPADEVPDGPDESANRELRRVGTPPAFDFEPRDHVALGEALGGMDFTTAAGLSGARFVVLKGAFARLSRALAQFMLDTHTSAHGYTEINTPVLVRDDALRGTGQLPKLVDDMFRTDGGLWLIPTAEVTLTNTVADSILAEADLPRRMTAHTLCFRAEAGAAGKDTRGMIRQHQFEKVEMVSIVRPDDSAAELERMTGCAEAILKALELPYRVMELCAGDMGFAARRTYDLEVWLPGQQAYREISSCSACGDFQARRMKARYRPEGDEKGTRLVHTLNGSGLAVGRALVALVENHQQADGSIRVPAALQPYMGGMTVIAGHV
ncbi:serine--tRNA ligase [Roseospirillum parvum]|uniref:Serine--tRNA ligase n=1 Tax=Roseospirillum parvum TaxID=83401 RepID=A0A1G7YIC7_9PROT|nr:serine--tRNA ligase [Roseospirillum parvum]SDG95995.1 seryl-tRNA synthetase [Roseospirillum parvum]